jgi:hypothetical protein
MDCVDVIANLSRLLDVIASELSGDYWSFQCIIIVCRSVIPVNSLLRELNIGKALPTLNWLSVALQTWSESCSLSRALH